MMISSKASRSALTTLSPHFLIVLFFLALTLFSSFYLSFPPFVFLSLPPLSSSFFFLFLRLFLLFLSLTYFLFSAVLLFFFLSPFLLPFFVLCNHPFFQIFLYFFILSFLSPFLPHNTLSSLLNYPFLSPYLSSPPFLIPSLPPLSSSFFLSPFFPHLYLMYFLFSALLRFLSCFHSCSLSLFLLIILPSIFSLLFLPSFHPTFLDYTAVPKVPRETYSSAGRRNKTP